MDRKFRHIDSIKSQLLNPALTSHFMCRILTPGRVSEWMSDSASIGHGLPATDMLDYLSIACSDASLPGSNLMTHEQSNDFHGITQRMAYRRDYGSSLDFTFIVDGGGVTASGGSHHLISFFENWLRYIVNEKVPGQNGRNPAISDSTEYPTMEKFGSYSRVNYYNEYASGRLYIQKFERNYEDAGGIQYEFLNAYPTAISAMPVSYEASQLLKCTVSFTYERYYVAPITSSPAPATAISQTPGVPAIPFTGMDENLAIWALSNQGMLNNQTVTRPGNYLALQQQILADANTQYPVGSPQRAVLLGKARVYNPSVIF